MKSAASRPAWTLFAQSRVRAAELFSVLARARRDGCSRPVLRLRSLPIRSLTGEPSCGSSGPRHRRQRNPSREVLVSTFLADAPKKLAVIRRAVSESDSGALAAAAHALKGSLSLMGATKAAGTARNLQAMGRLGVLDGAPAELAVLEAEFKELQKQLIAIEGKSGASPKHPPKRETLDSLPSPPQEVMLTNPAIDSASPLAARSARAHTDLTMRGCLSVVTTALLLSSCAILLAPHSACADDLKLKDGSKVSGTIVGFEENSFKVKTSYGFAIVQKDQVVSISMSAADKTSDASSGKIGARR